MCFIIHKDYPNALIAEKVIVCYKYTNDYLVFYSYFYSMFYNFKYSFKIQYNTKIEPRANHIFEGFHSSIKPKAYLLDSPVGFSIIECIIPKGSKYYVNPDAGEYVSDTIIPIKELDKIQI